ncbi:MAG: hypothetical protein U0996_17610 [Planctomycetaceae bacterium]
MTIPAFQAFDHVHVHVLDRVSAEEWYRRVLGLERYRPLEHWASDDGPLMVQNASGSVRLALFQRPPMPTHVTVAMRVSGEDYRGWKKHLDDAINGCYEEQDHGAAISIYFTDPDGNPFEITTYDVTAAKGNARFS